MWALLMLPCGDILAGKTMLAKALAAESRCFFLNVTASAVMSKWYGDANRFIRAIFTLAAKMEPCIIFIGGWRWASG